MKNSFLKILIIPHNDGEKKWVRLPIIFLFLILIIFIITVFIFFNNLGKSVDITSTVFLRTDNQRLREKVEILKQKKELLKAVSDSLINHQREALKKYNIKMIKHPEISNCSIDTLMLWERWIDTVLTTVLNTEDSILSMIPSIMPVKGQTIKFFGDDVDPYTGKTKPHKGINILSRLNSPVIATASGRIINIDHNKGIGLFVEVAHCENFITLYGHLLSITVKENDPVRRGDIIGYVGQSGRAPYPYLYFEVRKDSVYIDPMKVILGESL